MVSYTSICRSHDVTEFGHPHARRGDVLFHKRGQHLHPGPDGEGQQTLAELTGQLRHGQVHRVRQRRQARVDVLVLVGLAHGGPLPRGVLGGSPEVLPFGRSQVGDRHLKFHESWDNLSDRPPAVSQGRASDRLEQAPSFPNRHPNQERIIDPISGADTAQGLGKVS